MRESERQILHLKSLLPHMRERVMASLALLLVAAVMTVSSSFAWIVLSSNPEVKGINTTLTSNGSLEIALANGTTITPPAESEVGDGGKDLVEKNITWGNLINLGDPAYGLENLVLRPATLNNNALLDEPLYAAKYGADGRVEVLESNFAYAYWNQDQFSADQVKYGVRAVASVTYGPVPGQNVALAAAVDAAKDANDKAYRNLRTLAKDPALQDLGGLMGKYIQAQIDEKLNGNEPLVQISIDEIQSIYDLMVDLKGNMELSADALAAIFNMEMLRRTEPSYLAENKFTGDYLLTAKQADIQKKLQAKNAANEVIVQPSMISQLWTLRTDYNQLTADIAVVETYVGRNDVVYRNLNDSTYPAIETYVNHIVDVSSTTVNGVAIGQLSMSNITGLTGSQPKPIVINKGILQRMDKFTGAQLESDDITVSIKVFGVKNDATGKATTSAAAPFVLPSEYDRALGADTSYKGSNPVAGDTFGMALDFFVRTNATDSHLILQGSPVYEERDEIVSATIDGESHNLYTVTFNDEKVIVFIKDDTYYSYNRDQGVVGDALGTTTELTDGELLREKVKYIVGYSGVNRVWDNSESAFLDADSTTQGAGSCYTFYSATPEDQEKSLQLLKYFRIAFINQSGELLAEAQLAVDKKVEQTGKVVVPLELSVTSDFVDGEDGEPLYTITPLECNTPTFITALVYLDGMGLTNDQVLAAGEIQGQLNIQFGTTADMDAMDNPELMESKCRVTATMEGDTSVSFDTATEAQLTKKVTVTVEGYEPTKVEAYFLREINSTQGIRQQKMVFEIDAEGNWIGEHRFEAPGKYVLREVFLDGVAYELAQQPIVFTVDGFAISSLYCADNGKTYMTLDKSFDTEVSLTFASDDVDKMPKSVKGAFIHQETGNRTTVYFTRTVGSTWVGEATLATSGEYRMDYLELDGEYTGLPENNHVTINLYLGLSASVYAGDTNFALENGESRDVGVSLIIRDDSGAFIGNLDNVWLQYSNNGSGTQELGVGARMVWNENREMYEGTFHLTRAGIYDYHYVTITMPGQTSTLNAAQVAPTITAISSNPPKYVSKEGFGEVFALNNSAKFTVRMKNADSATLDAALKNEAGETYYVRAMMEGEGDEQVFTFVLPIIDGVQSGNWTLQNLYMTNIYGGKDNILYDGSTENGPDTATETKPLYTVANNYYHKWLEWSIADLTNEGESEDVTVRLVSSVNVAFTDSELNAKNFGKTGDTVTASFGTVHQLGNLELEVTAGNDRKPLSEYGMSVTGVELKYNFDQTCVPSAVGGIVTNPYGEYTIDSASWTKLISVANTEYIYNTIVSNDGAVYTISTSNNRKEISTAGRYKAVDQISVTITDDTNSDNQVTVSIDVKDLNAPVFTVNSKPMSVVIDSIQPAVGTYNTVSQAQKKEVAVASTLSADKLETTVYCQATSSGQEITIVTPPAVTLRISGNENTDSVTMNFAEVANNTGSGYLYEENGITRATGYTWSNGAATQKRRVGLYSGGICGSGATLNGAGTVKASSLSIVMGDYTYGMTVNTITINNPHID